MDTLNPRRIDKYFKFGAGEKKNVYGECRISAEKANISYFLLIGWSNFSNSDNLLFINKLLIKMCFFEVADNILSPSFQRLKYKPFLNKFNDIENLFLLSE